MQSKLKEAYNPESFQETGIRLVEFLTNYLTKCLANKDERVINWKNPEMELNYWKSYNETNPMTFFSDVIDRSIHIQNPKYMGHQVVPPLPIATLASFLGAFINNGMATYDSGPAATSIEQSIVNTFKTEFGFTSNADGLLTSGGTLANLTALLCARQTKVDGDIWENGLTSRLAIITSDEAHYSIDRAARIMGFGSAGVVKVPVNSNYTMNTELLTKAYEDASNVGIKVIAVVGSAPSTSTGMYDDLLKIGDFCKKKNVWFHVDGAHGGAAIFSKKYKYLLEGVRNADSVIVDAHKMLLTPALATVLLFKDGSSSYGFKQKAQFLWDYSHEMESFNLAQRTIECTKYMMGIRLFSILQVYGKDIFDEYVTTMYDLARDFAFLIKANPNFELSIDPVSNIVCFRFVPRCPSHIDISGLNHAIRQKLIEDGEFHIVETTLKGSTFLRTTLMNPFTTAEHLKLLLNKITQIAYNLVPDLDQNCL